MLSESSHPFLLRAAGQEKVGDGELNLISTSDKVSCDIPFDKAVRAE